MKKFFTFGIITLLCIVLGGVVFSYTGISWLTPGPQVIAGDSVYGASYPRFVKDGSSLLVAYDIANPSGITEVRYKKSTDNGTTWGGDSYLAANGEGTGASTPQMLKLRNGDLLCAYLTGAHSGENHKIDIRKKNNNDDTWISHSTVATYNGGPQEGIWEPFMIEHPAINNKVYCFYATEEHNTSNNGQRIAYKVSGDGGKNWGTEELMPSSNPSGPNCRDGMPGVVFLGDNNTMYIVFETSQLGAPHPMVIKARTLDSSTGVWSGLKDVYIPSQAQRRAGAPFVVKSANGDLICSFQTDNDLAFGTYPQDKCMQGAYCISTDNGSTWGSKQNLFIVDKDDGVQFVKSNTLFMLNDTSIIAGSRSNKYTGTTPQILIKKGSLN